MQELTGSATVEMENVSCPLGCGAGDRPVLVGHDRLHGLPGDFDVVQCTACGLVRTNPRPTRNSIGYYYPADYSPHRSNTARSRTGVIAGLRTRLLQLQPSWLRNRRLPPVVPGRLLEIGCATGRYLQEMQNAGWEVSGIESSPAAASSARADGLEVWQGSVSGMPEVFVSYDVIVGWMVLEHLHDPVSDLKELRGRVADDGWLVLSVPDAAGWFGFRLFRSNWYALDIPRHLFQFTPQTLTSVLEAAGWKPVKFYWQHDAANFFLSLRYWLLEQKLASLAALCGWIARHRGNPLIAALAVCFGVTRSSGRVVVWARPGPNSKKSLTVS